MTRACAMATASNRDMGCTPHAACRHTRRTGRTCRTRRTRRTVVRIVRIELSHASYVSNRRTRHTCLTVTRVTRVEPLHASHVPNASRVACRTRYTCRTRCTPSTTRWNSNRRKVWLGISQSSTSHIRPRKPNNLQISHMPPLPTPLLSEQALTCRIPAQGEPSLSQFSVPLPPWATPPMRGSLERHTPRPCTRRRSRGQRNSERQGLSTDF